MLIAENFDVWGFEHAIRGMRNPLNSWEKSDSFPCDGYDKTWDECAECPALIWEEGNEYMCAECIVGQNDMDLMQRLHKAGTEHRKYMRQIMVSCDITAPLYWWKEFDTYKIGTTANSCSTMHKIAAKEFEMNDFSHEHLYKDSEKWLNDTINALNIYRKYYLKSKDKNDWWQLIQLLPSSYNQKRTVTMNYENCINMIKQRKNHKLDEWHTLVNEFIKLPYLAEIAGLKEND